jgi:Mg/Co/Ni transporter MgtE
MDPDAAADVLGELTPEQSSEILEEMEPEEREEVTELLAFEEDTAAGRMTTDFVWTYEDLTVANAIDVLRKYEGQSETINTIFLVDDNERLSGAVPLNRLVLASAHTRLADLKQEPLIFCEPDANESEVAELFDKYNLSMLPVLDAERRIAGVITADDVISILRRKL